MKKLFKNLGLSEKDSNAYLKLLELGAQPVSILARNLGIARSSSYVILERLKNSGFIEEFERKNIKYVKSISPKDIKNLLLQKEEKIHKTMNLLDESLNDLEKIESKLSITPIVNFYEGINEVEKVYEKILLQNNFYSFVNLQSVKNLTQYFHKIPINIKKNNLEVKELIVNSEEGKEYKKLYNSKTHKIKLLEKTLDFKSDIFILKNSFFMISFGENNISAVEIVNKSLTDFHKQIFEKFWENS